MEEIVYPLARGDFVIRKYDDRVARVRSIWWDSYEKEFCMNLSFYEHSGDEPGRVSPAMGGPSAFEPAVRFNEEWERIETPDFPLDVRYKWVPDGEGKAVSKRVVEVSRISFRALKRAPKKRKAILPPAHIRSDYNAELEASSRRLTAQTLRDMARTMDPAGAAKLKEQAEAFEAEADKIMPRTIFR